MSDIETFMFEDDGLVPNSAFPLIVYRRAILPSHGDPAATFETLFSENGWGGTWRDGIFPYHHYHSNAHEVLGIARGQGRVQFGGEAGAAVDVSAGDVVLIPAGTGHKRLSSSEDFLVVGAYPPGQEDYDILRDTRAEHDRALDRIAAVDYPPRDPVEGEAGPMQAHWRSEGG